MRSEQNRYGDLIDREFSVAVIGAGYWGRKCISTIQETFPLAQISVCDPRLGREYRQEGWVNQTRVRPIEEVLQDEEIQAALICTPVSTHGEIAMEFLRFGKSILVEKPFGLDGNQVLEAKRSRQNGQVVTPGYLYHFNPAVVRLSEIIHEGNLGKLVYLESRRLGFGAFRKDISPVLDLMVHDFSILKTWFPSSQIEVNRVQENLLLATGQFGEVSVEATSMDGLEIRLLASHMRTKKTRKMTLVFEEGSITFDEMRSQPLTAHLFPKGLMGHSKNEFRASNDYLDLAEAELSLELDEPTNATLRRSISSFLDAVILGAPVKLSIEFAESIREVADEVESWGCA